MQLGDYTKDQIINFKFPTRGTSGSLIGLSGTPSVVSYKGSGIAPSNSGITLTTNFNGVTGLNHVRVLLSNAYYESGVDYTLVLQSGIVDSINIQGEVVGSFSIGNRYAPVATGGGSSDWSSLELEQIRYRLGIDGTSSIPIVNSNMGNTPLLVRANVSLITSQTQFRINSGTTESLSLREGMIVFRRPSGQEVGFSAVSNYVGSIRDITLQHAPAGYTISTGDIVEVYADKSVKAASVNNCWLGIASNAIQNVTNVTNTTNVLGSVGGSVVGNVQGKVLGGGVSALVGEGVIAQIPTSGITSAKFDNVTAFPIAFVDSGPTQIARSGDLTGGSSSGDWTSLEKEQIRYRLGLNGVVSVPTGTVNLNFTQNLTSYGVPTTGDLNTVNVNIVNAINNLNDFDPTSQSVTVGTNNDKTGYRLSTSGVNDITGGSTVEFARTGILAAINAIGANSGVTDWTDTERQYIRYRLGLGGLTAVPTGSVNLNVITTSFSGAAFTSINSISAQLTGIQTTGLWTPTEKQHIRNRLGINGSSVAPTGSTNLGILQSNLVQISGSNGTVSNLISNFSAPILNVNSINVSGQGLTRILEQVYIGLSGYPVPKTADITLVNTGILNAINNLNDFDPTVQSVIVGSNLDKNGYRLSSTGVNDITGGSTVEFARTGILNAINELGANSGVTDWTSTERDQIRYRLGVDGSTSVPTLLPNLGIVQSNTVTFSGQAQSEIDLIKASVTGLHNFDPNTDQVTVISNLDKDGYRLSSTGVNDITQGTSVNTAYTGILTALQNIPQSGDWSEIEKAQFRERLGIDGARSNPTGITNLGLLEVNSIYLSGQALTSLVNQMNIAMSGYVVPKVSDLLGSGTVLNTLSGMITGGRYTAFALSLAPQGSGGGGGGSGNVTVIFDPVIGICEDDVVNSTSIGLYVGETTEKTIYIYQNISGSYMPLDLTSLNLTLVIEDMSRTDIQVSKTGSGISITGLDNNGATFNINPSVTERPGNYYGSLRIDETKKVLWSNQVNVCYAPLLD